MQVIIAEKPLLGAAIADAIPGQAKQKAGVIYKGDYAIVSAHGHLLTLKDPEDYNEDYKEWTLEQLPIYFKDWGHKVTPDRRGGHGTSNAQLVKQIGELLKGADSVIHAGDIDDEGQLLIDELLRWHKYKGPVKRLNTSDLSKAALGKALRSMTDNREHESAGWAAYGRQVCDKLFGYNLTRYYTKKNRTLMTLGRVQTPTLGLVVNRDAMIEGFEKTVYYELIAHLGIGDCLVEAKYIPNPDLVDGKYYAKAPLEAVRAQLLSEALPPVQIRKSLEKDPPPLPFNLNKLNLYCSKKWGMKPTEVMKVTQSLRETHKAITYNRSDCQYLTEEQYAEAPGVIHAAAKALGLTRGMFDEKLKSRCFNSNNVTAHTAIIPTSEPIDIKKLSENERRVYTAIALYYLAQFMPLSEREKTNLLVELPDDGKLTAVSSVVLKATWRDLLRAKGREEGDADEEEQTTSLSSIPAGDYQGTVRGATIVEKETKPPARYTQTTLVDDMSSVAKYVNDPEIKRLLLLKDDGKKGEHGSIGTSATRDRIVLRLIETGFLVERREGKRDVLVSTEKGRAFYAMLPDSIKLPDTTAKWWVIQEDIKAGNATPEEMAESVLETVREIIDSGKGTLTNASRFAGGATGMVVGDCPFCGKEVVERQKVYGCVDPDCGFVIFKDSKLLDGMGKKLSPAMAKSLLLKGSVDLKNCKSQKTGNRYDCVLVAEFKEKQASLHIEFADSSQPEKVFGVCPLCSGSIVKNRFGNFSCSNWKQGCKFTLYGTVCGKKLTDKTAMELINRRRTKVLSGFKSQKTGKTFDAALTMDDTGKTSFVFPDRHTTKP